MHGEKFYQLHTEQRQLLRPLNNLEKGSFRNRENLQYKKTADSVLSSLFMRTNGKCNNSQVPYYHQNIKKTLTLYRCTGRSFTNSTQNNDNCCDKFWPLSLPLVINPKVQSQTEKVSPKQPADHFYFFNCTSNSVGTTCTSFIQTQHTTSRISTCKKAFTQIRPLLKNSLIRSAQFSLKLVIGPRRALTLLSATKKGADWADSASLQSVQRPHYLCLYVLILYIPVNIFSIMSGRVLLGWTSTERSAQPLVGFANKKVYLNLLHEKVL